MLLRVYIIKKYHSSDIIWVLIENKINPNNFNNKIRDYDKLRFNSDIDLPLDALIESHSLVINVKCVIGKDKNISRNLFR